MTAFPDRPTRMWQRTDDRLSLNALFAELQAKAAGVEQSERWLRRKEQEAKHRIGVYVALANHFADDLPAGWVIAPAWAGAHMPGVSANAGTIAPESRRSERMTSTHGSWRAAVSSACCAKTASGPPDHPRF
jgi:hypothetical protein